MKQLVQSLRTGQITAEEVALPLVQPRHLLIRTTHSLISAGTERMLVEFGRGSYLAKARQQPDKVRQALDKVRTDGLGATLHSVAAKLDEPLPMGYSNVGRVIEVGPEVEGFAVGDRVASNGRHAEAVLVGVNLAAKVPDRVTDEQACFTVLGAIALQGIRLLEPAIGETVAVFGLGLIGLLAVQILRAGGTRVIGFDRDSTRVELARRFGAESHDVGRGGADPVRAALAATGQIGVDGVLVTVSTTSDLVMHQAAAMCRQRGRIVLTGVTGLNLRRDDFYRKELTFQVSCSYGPGRYDPRYEEHGHDYPLGFVRWTEQRNMAAVLELMAEQRLHTEPLVSLRAPLAEAPQAYNAVADRSVIGVVLTYPEPPTDAQAPSASPRVVHHHAARSAPGGAVIGLIGAGGFAVQQILPALAKTGARLKWVATSSGLSGATAARKFSIEASTTEVDRLFDDPELSAVVVATRHDTHARFVMRGLAAGKAVFVEKPLCLSRAELDAIRAAHTAAAASGAPLLMVGYNRRFAPLVEMLRARLEGRTEPLAMTFTCNAGQVPADHWIHDRALGGGRIAGEACHFIDLLHFLTGESPIVEVAALAQRPTRAAAPAETASIVLRFADGSLGTVNYFAGGPRSYPKERLDVFSDGRVLHLDNFRRLEIFGPRREKKRAWRQDKGHEREFEAFVAALRDGGPPPIAAESLFNTALATLAAVEALQRPQAISLA